MKVPVGQLYNAIPIVDRLIEQMITLDTAIGTIYRMRCNATAIAQSAAVTAFATMREDIIRQHGQELENGEIRIAPDSPAFGEVVRKINELGKDQVELEIRPLTVEELQQFKLKWAELEVLAFMVEELQPLQTEDQATEVPT